VRDKGSLIFYFETKLVWAREEYVACSKNERSGLAWFKTGIWKLGGVRKASEKRRSPPLPQ
jgi:hypothetical protein